MHRNEVLAESIARARRLLPMFLGGFNDDNRIAQAPNLPNHAAWTLGHSAWEFHELAAKLDGAPMLPDGDFIAGTTARGDTDRYAEADIESGSTPVADPARYPTLDRGVAIYERACDRLIQALRDADDAALDAELAVGDAAQPLYKWVLVATWHSGYHTGQLADLRRALGMPPLFGPA